MRQQADAAHRTGNFPQAIQLQRKVVELSQKDGNPAVDARKLLALYHYSAEQREDALEILRSLAADAPDDVEIVENTGVILRQLGRKEEAIEALLEAHRRDPKRANVCDALAHGYATLGDGENCQKFGRLSLQLKDEEAASRPTLRSIPSEPPPPFLPAGEKKNVISFSLWGSDPRYVKGALRNAAAAIDVYPGWTVRFYCDDSVPAAVVKRLKEYGVEIHTRPAPESFFDGLLWRFEVVSDPTVARFLIRDCDSVLNVKERVAVDEWLASDKWFHAMRDYPSHTEVILAGMWGGVAGILPEVGELRENFHPTTAPTRTFDQQLLREVVWPMVRESVMIHDSVYTGALDSVPYPDVGTLPPGYHIGQNEAAVRKSVFVPMPGSSSAREESLFLLSGLDSEAVGYCCELMGQLDPLTLIESPSLEELRGNVSILCDSMKDESAQPEKQSALELEMLASSIEALAKSRSDEQTKRVGIVDKSGERDVLENLASRLEAKVLCVIRDPRDSASSQRISSPEDASSWANDWKSHLDFVARLNRKYPAQVELIRYEDLSAGQAIQAIARFCKFLHMGATIKAVRSPGIIDSGKPLPDEIREIIESEAGDFLKKLRYLD